MQEQSPRQSLVTNCQPLAVQRYTQARHGGVVVLVVVVVVVVLVDVLVVVPVQCVTAISQLSVPGRLGGGQGHWSGQSLTMRFQAAPDHCQRQQPVPQPYWQRCGPTQGVSTNSPHWLPAKLGG